MSNSRAILTTPFLAALLATAFCVWSAMGNDVNFCVTTGCTLYQDFSIGGISLWWFGTGAFTLLAACALSGQQGAGRWLAGLFLLGDIFLLALMALTATCVSCLVAAMFFALCYFLFSSQPRVKAGQQQKSRRSFLLWLWAALFIINLGFVARSQLDVWPILDESGDPRMRMFFSPSCPYCVEGLNALSGKVNVAFYPVAENNADVYRLAKMQTLLAEGMSIAEALGQSMETTEPEGFEWLKPEIILLRFRLLRNKAHIFSSGSQSVPFFETKGLPADILAEVKKRNRERAVRGLPPAGPPPATADSGPKDHALPVELEEGQQCGGAIPCPPAQ